MKTEQTASPVLVLKTADEVKALITLRYACAGGTKVAVMRDLFAQGYKVKHVWAMLKDQRVGPDLFVKQPQMVDNYWRTWTRLQG